MNWKYFYGASFLVFMLLLKYGAPIPALVAGIALAVLLNWKMQHKAPAKAQRKSPPSGK
jgi:hypothetical protein